MEYVVNNLKDDVGTIMPRSALFVLLNVVKSSRAALNEHHDATYGTLSVLDLK